MFCAGKLHLLYNLPPHSIVDRVCSAANCTINCTRVSTCGKMEQFPFTIYSVGRLELAPKYIIIIRTTGYCNFKLISISSTFSNSWNIFFSYVTFRRPIGQVAVSYTHTLRESNSLSLTSSLLPYPPTTVLFHSTLDIFPYTKRWYYCGFPTRPLNGIQTNAPQPLHPQSMRVISQPSVKLHRCGLHDRVATFVKRLCCGEHTSWSRG